MSGKVVVDLTSLNGSRRQQLLQCDLRRLRRDVDHPCKFSNNGNRFSSSDNRCARNRRQWNISMVHLRMLRVPAIKLEAAVKARGKNRSLRKHPQITQITQRID